MVANALVRSVIRPPRPACPGDCPIPPATTAGPLAGSPQPLAVANGSDAPTDAVLTAEARPKRGIASLATAFFFFALHLTVLSVLFVEFSWVAVAFAVAVYVARGFGLTAGYHRYFAHRAYKTSRWFQFVLGTLGASALQRGPMWWAGHHRVHHKHSDDDEDPHSPVAKTIWWSHVGWVVSNRYNQTEWQLMKDFQKYPEIKFLEKWDLVPGIALGFACFVFGWALGGVDLGLSCLAYAFFVGTIVLYHSTFMVNSVCHLFGRRRFATSDHSRNNWFVAILTLGEGWHNNHHHYPSSARQGFKWYEYDLSYMILKMLSWVGIVWDLRAPTPRALAARPQRTTA